MRQQGILLQRPEQLSTLSFALEDEGSLDVTCLRLSSKGSQHAAKAQTSALLSARRSSATANFSIGPSVRTPVIRHRRTRLRHEEACFASLLQSFTKSKAEGPQTAKLDNRPPNGESKALGWSKHLLCGALSAVVSRTTMAPLERIKLEIVLHKRQETMFEVALGVFDQNGVQGFWKGNGLNILRTAPYKVTLHTATLVIASTGINTPAELCLADAGMRLS